MTTIQIMTETKQKLDKIKTKLIELKTKKEILETNLKAQTSKLDKTKSDKEILQEAVLVVQQAINETQQNLEVHINPIINASLSEVLEEPYTFNVRFGARGKSTKTSEIWFELSKDGILLEDKLVDQVGGGVVHLIALALRASILVLNKSVSKVLIFDEPLVALRGKDYPIKAAELIKSLSNKLNIQIIIVSHEMALKEIADKLIEL